MQSARSVPLATIALGLIALAGIGLLLKGFVFRSTSGASRREIGSVVSVKGEATHRLPRSVAVEPLQAGRPYLAEEQITTRTAAEVVVVLANGTRLKIGENSRFVAETDPLKPPGAFVATVLDGEVTVAESGKAGTFRMLKQGAEIYPQTTARAGGVPVLPAVPGPQATPGSDLEQGVVISATLPDEASTPLPTVTPSDGKAAEETTDLLTNDDILKRMRSQTGLFQRCYLNLIQRNRDAKKPAPTDPASGGTVVVSFTIQPNGRVTDTRAVKSDFTDATFNKCATEVVERTAFRAFKGGAIPIAEFPITVR